MKKVTVTYARKHFSQILAQAEAGEEVAIVRSGIPIARLVGLSTRRVLGRFRDSVWVADDFDSPLPDEILAAFEERSPKKKIGQKKPPLEDQVTDKMP
jgi:prevent-host-death family protein